MFISGLCKIGNSEHLGLRIKSWLGSVVAAAYLSRPYKTIKHCDLTAKTVLAVLA